MIPYPWTPDWPALAVLALVIGVGCLVAWRWRGRI